MIQREEMSFDGDLQQGTRVSRQEDAEIILKWWRSIGQEMNEIVFSKPVILFEWDAREAKLSNRSWVMDQAPGRDQPDQCIENDEK